MKNIYSNILKVNKKNLSKAINYLKKDGVIGIPTETVYGLAGNAYSKKPIKQIYKLKKRPKINPLIIHYYSVSDLNNDAKLNKKFYSLYNKLCPGPITFILNKKINSKIISSAVANLSTIAVRFPKHQVIRNILKELKFPLAIPSANQSSGISPVNSKDVFEEFGKKIKLIINGGNSKIGIESTVVDLTGKVKILRPGIISSSRIGKILKKKILPSSKSRSIKAPGNLKKHYSPGIPMKLNQIRSSKNDAFIIFGKNYKNSKHTFNLSLNSNLNEAARNLYKTFRKIKKRKYKKIYVVKIPNVDIGIAINDRLKRASS